MAFQAGLTLDDFNRANGAPGANWTAIGGALTIVSNQLKATAASSFSYWNPATYGASQRAYVDLVTKNVFGGAGPGLVCRYDSVGVNGYNAFFDTGNNIVQIYRADGGAFTAIGSSAAVTLVNGESIGMDAVGPIITAYRKTGGVWSSLVSASDSTYPAGGKVAVQVNDTTTVVDNFGGGSYARPFDARRTNPRSPRPSSAFFS